MRVVGDNVEQPVVLPIRDALKLADEMELDLIEISPKADPPVCRIADYQKFLYQQKRKAKELKAKTVKVTIKEIRFGPQTDDHDYNFKLRLGRDFDKVELLFAGEPERLAGRHHCRTAFDAVAHHPHLRDGNPLVNPIGRLLLHPSGVRSALLAGSRRGRFGTVSFLYGVYSFVLLD